MAMKYCHNKISKILLYYNAVPQNTDKKTKYPKGKIPLAYLRVRRYPTL